MKPKSILCAVLISASVVATGQDYSKDEKMGKEGLQQVEEQMGFYEINEANAVIEKLGQRLVRQLETPLFKYEFYIVDSPEPNAFALPGGKIFVTRGLLVLPLTEDELAGVIGHEIIHANNRHSVKQQRSNIFTTILTLPGIILGGVVGGPVGEMAASPFIASNQLLKAGYSRSHEHEADEEGIVLAAKAGYNPRSLADILNRLQQEANYLTGEEAKKSYFDSHPYTPKRVKSINKEADDLHIAEPNPIVPPASFTAIFNNVLVGFNPANGYVKNGTFYHPKNLFSVNLDTTKWQTAITPVSFSVASKDKDAILSLVCETDTLTAHEIVDYLEKAMKKKANIDPDKKENISWHGYNGTMMEYKFEEGGERGVFEIVVLNYRDGKTLKFASLYKAESKAKVESILKTAKPISKAELPTTNVKRMMVVHNKEEQPLSQIIDHFNAEEYTNLTEIINNKKAGEVVAKGERIKVIVPSIFSF